MGRTLLEASNIDIFQQEVSMAMGAVQTDRLISTSPTFSANPLPTSVAVELNHTIQLRVKVLVRQRSGSNVGDSACFELLATFKNMDGTVSQVGSTTTVASHTDNANWSLDFTLFENRIYIQCTYADPTLEAGNTNIWTAYLYTFDVSE